MKSVKSITIKSFIYLFTFLTLSACADKDPSGEIISNPPTADTDLSMISTLGTTYDQEVLNKKTPLLPRGSAIRTSSGDLESTGIQAIIHAAPGIQNFDQRIDGPFIPTLEGVAHSVQNAMILAQSFNHKKIAIPMIGGNIYMQSIAHQANISINKARKQLADQIVRAALTHRGNLEIVFLDTDSQNFKAFQDVFNSIRLDPALIAHVRHIQTMNISILLSKTHQADVIVNAANMDVHFGGGISGAIGIGAGSKAQEINQYARGKIQAFNLLLLQSSGSWPLGKMQAPAAQALILIANNAPARNQNPPPAANAPARNQNPPPAQQNADLFQLVNLNPPPADLNPPVNPVNNPVKAPVVDEDLFMISTQGTVYDHQVLTYATPFLPYGSAFETGSGDLGNSGIRGIIHAASGINPSRHTFNQLYVSNLNDLKLSIQNAIILAERGRYNKIAIPMIGGQLFIPNLAQSNGISQDEARDLIAETIVQAALSERKNLDIVFIDLNQQNYNAFNNIHKRVIADPTLARHAPHIQVMNGSVTSFNDHGADAIVNAASVDIQFTQGISQVIGTATGADEDNINRITALKIKAFNDKVLKDYNFGTSQLVNDPVASNPLPQIAKLPPALKPINQNWAFQNANTTRIAFVSRNNTGNFSGSNNAIHSNFSNDDSSDSDDDLSLNVSDSDQDPVIKNGKLEEDQDSGDEIDLGIKSGVPMTSCQVKLMGPEFWDYNKSTLPIEKIKSNRAHMAENGLLYTQQIQTPNLTRHKNITTPLALPKVLNRWGIGKWENKLIENFNNGQAIFDINKINVGASVQGKGLYCDPTPTGSYDYGIATTKAKDDLEIKDVHLTTIIVPAGTHFHKGSAVGDTSPVLVNYSGTWHVLKTTDGVIAKQFDGNEYSMNDLFRYQDKMDRKAKFQQDFSHLKALSIATYFRTLLDGVKKYRTFKKGIYETVPTPLTAKNSFGNWKNVQEIKHCAGLDVPKKQFHYFTYDGRCASYADAQGDFLINIHDGVKIKSLEDLKQNPENYPPCYRDKNYPIATKWIEDPIRPVKKLCVYVLNDEKRIIVSHDEASINDCIIDEKLIGLDVIQKNILN